MNLIERHHVQSVLAGNIAAGARVQLDVQLDIDAPFVLRGFDGNYKVAVTEALTRLPGTLVVRMADAGGRWRQNATIGAASMVGEGGNGQYAPVWPQIVYPTSSTVQIELTNSGASTLNDVRLYLWGVKLFQPGFVWAPQPPDCFATRPFELAYTLTFAAANGTPQRGLLVPNDSDNDFIFRAGSFTLNPGSAGWNKLDIVLRDPNGKAYSNDWCSIDQFFAYGRRDSARPALMYPEIYIPARSGLLLDARLVSSVGGVAPFSYQLLMQGAKVIPGGRA